MTRRLLERIVVKFRSSRALRKVGIAIAGFSVVAVGVAMVVLPGPAILVVPLGLAILAKEFPWARRLVSRLKDGVNRLSARARRLFAVVTSGTPR